MTFLEKLNKAVEKNNSLLCVGFDPVLDKFPKSIQEKQNPLFEFNKAIIDQTAGLVCGYKLNSAFFEAYGADGINQLKATSDYIKQAYPDVIQVLDFKRADIGSSNEGYLKYAFEYLQADGVTLQPWLGREALEPFLAKKDKELFILCRTSNPGAGEFQDLEVEGKPLYQYVATQVSKEWNTNGNCSLVVGATYPEEMQAVREIVGSDMPLFVPGIGAQGGDLAATLKAGLNKQKRGLIIVAVRSIIYASGEDNFAEAAAVEAKKLRDEINKYRN